MLLKQEFFGTCNNLGLEDGELTLAEIVWERCEKATQGNSMYKPVLSQSELQYLTDGIAGILRYDEEQLEELKFLIEKLWNKSNPDDPESEVSFTIMNNLRNLQRKLKKTHKTLAVIQHKLKKMKGK